MTPANVQPIDDLDLKDLTDHAEDLIATMIAVFDREELSLAAVPVWEAAMEMIQHTAPVEQGYTPERRLAYVLALDALYDSSDGVVWALRHLRNRLVEQDPALKLLRCPAE
jgi:hypothetical protein